MTFAKHNNANPTGRPKGSLNKATQLRSQMMECLPEVLAVLKEQALAGDSAAIKLLLDKTMPNIKPIPAPAVLPITATTPDSEAADLIFQSAVEGELDPDYANSMLNLIGTRRRLEAEIAETETQQQIAEIHAKAYGRVLGGSKDENPA